MLITNAKLITWDETGDIQENMAILINNDRIIDIGPQWELLNKYAGEEQLDAHDQYVMPGNICAHTHFYGAFARGLAIPGPAPKDFPEILEKLWWPLDRSLTDRDIYLSALVMLVDAIKNGTTTLIDHHASPNCISGSLDLIAEAVSISGLRSVLCYEVTDRDGKEKAQAGIDENIRFIQRLKNNQFGDGRIAGTFGLHASFTLSDSTLELCRTAAPDDTGFHIHVAEHEADEYDSLAKAGTRVTDRLNQHGILGPKTIVAHAVHVDAREIALLAENNTWVTHQPRSNMNNGVGVTDVDSLLRSGIKVCIGTDGFPHTMWEEWKTAYLIQKVWHRDPRRMPGQDIVRMGVYNNSSLAKVFFPQAPIGVLMPGAFADLIFVDYHPYTPLNKNNLPWHIIFGFFESMVTTTIVAGRVLMRDRRILTLDEEEIAAKGLEQAPAVWKRYYDQF